MDNHTPLSVDSSQPQAPTPPSDASIANAASVLVMRVSGSQNPAEPVSPANASTPIVFAPISPAESSALALTPPQRTALEHLTSGHSVASAALAAGVHRNTLHRWLRSDPEFTAAYNAWQQDIISTARGRLLALTDTAVTTLGRTIADGDGRLAFQLLDRMGLTTAPTPGPTDAAEIKRQEAADRDRLQRERQKEEDQLFLSTIRPIEDDIPLDFDDLQRRATRNLDR